MKLFNVIDEDRAEKMIESHNRYEFFGGRVAVVRDDPNEPWYVYLDSREVHVAFDNTKEPVPFAELADALAVALSPRNHEIWDF